MNNLTSSEYHEMAKQLHALNIVIFDIEEKIEYGSTERAELYKTRTQLNRAINSINQLETAAFINETSVHSL